MTCQRKENLLVKIIRLKLPLRKQMPSRTGDGLPRVFLSEPGGSTAEVLLYGGQVVSWKNEHREEMLFMSNKGTWKSPKGIMGGIHACFPQFTSAGLLERHHFARNRLWSIDNDPLLQAPAIGRSCVDLISKSTEADLKLWQRSFELRLRIALGPDNLSLISRVRNTSRKALSFTFSLRSYLAVSDISDVRVEGLETLDYLDNLEMRERFTEQADAVTFDGAVDRVYLSTPKKIAVIDHKKKRTFEMHKEGLPDAVVWNPWEKVWAKAIPDFRVGDYKTVLCLGSAAIERPITVIPFEEWRGCQELTTVSSSYCSGRLDARMAPNSSASSHC